MTKICCFCEKWESGGIESFLRNVYIHLDLNELELHIVVAELKQSVFTKELCAHGIVFHELSGNRKNIFQNYWLFVKLLRKECYDLIHLNIYHDVSLFYMYLSKLMGVKIRIAHAHNSALQKNSVYFFNILLHNFAKHLFSNFATSLWACSEKAAAFTFSAYVLSKKKFTFIPNGIELNRFHYDSVIREKIRNELGLTKKLVIGNVGRLCYQKNQDFLIDILSIAIKQNSDCRLLLVGDGAEQQMLKQKVKRLGLNDSVIFLGTSSHVEHLMCAMDIFAFPSRFEGLGTVAVEAQAVGLPVICSNNIPAEACVTPFTSVLSLNMGAKKWADKVLNSKTLSDTERTHNRECLLKAGFDISNTINMIVIGYKTPLFL